MLVPIFDKVGTFLPTVTLTDADELLYFSLVKIALYILVPTSSPITVSCAVPLEVDLVSISVLFL